MRTLARNFPDVFLLTATWFRQCSCARNSKFAFCRCVLHRQRSYSPENMCVENTLRCCGRSEILCIPTTELSKGEGKRDSRESKSLFVDASKSLLPWNFRFFVLVCVICDNFRRHMWSCGGGSSREETLWRFVYALLLGGNTLHHNFP